MPKSPTSDRPAGKTCRYHAQHSSILLLLAASALAGCSKLAKAADPPAAVPVVVAMAQGANSGTDFVRYPATIARDREAELSFRVGGVLTALPVRIGERLSQGEPVARIDGTPYRSARIRAQEEVERLARAAIRAHALVPVGAMAPATDEDSQSALSSARAVLLSARYDEASTVLKAPFSGIVLERSAETGETVAPGTKVLRLADLNSPLIARAEVPPEVASHLKTGMVAKIDAAGSGSFLATIRHVGAAADALAGTVEIELTLPSASSLASGSTVSVAFPSSRMGTAGEAIPAEALLDANGAIGHVYIVEPARSTARRVEVKLSGFDGELLHVEGLPPNAKVITYGAGLVRDGERVEIVRQ